MLSQKILKELLIYKNNEAVKQSVGISIYIFENTLLALKNGGEVFTDLNLKGMRPIPPANDPVLIDEISSVLTLWERFKTEAYAYIDNEEKEHLENIIAINPLLLERLNSIVLILQESSEWSNTVLNIFIYALIGISVLSLLVFLRYKVIELKDATRIIEELETILPICSNCKRIREKKENSDEESWVAIEDYISRKDATKFTHGICPDCAKKLYPGLM